MEPKPKRNQVLVPVPMKPEFIKELSDALGRLGYSNRADFIRDAVLEKLEREGEKIPASIAAAPVRTGKGGPKRAVARFETLTGALNEGASSEKTNAAVAAGGKKVSYMVRKPRKPAGV